jgi:hypothetical protein
VDAFKILSNEITMLAIADDVIWPYYTVPYFDRHSYLDQRLTRTQIQALIPLVRLNQREKWLQYTVKNQNWTTIPDKGYENVGISAYNSSRRVQSTSSSVTNIPSQQHQYQRYDLEQYYEGTEIPMTSIPPYMRRMSNYSHGRLVAQTDDNEIYLPIWQNTPLDLLLVNYDIYSEPASRNGFDAVRNTLDNIFSEAFFPFYTQDATIVTEDPYAIIISPVFSNFFHQDGTAPKSEDIVAIVASIIPWQVFFSKLYTADSLNGLILILTDPAGKNFTFRVDGPTVRCNIVIPAHRGYGFLHVCS